MASPCCRITRIELKVFAVQPEHPSMFSGKQEEMRCRRTNTPSSAVKVATHTRGVSGRKKPHGSTFSPVNPLIILTFPL